MIEKLKELYKADKKAGTRVWYVEIDGDSIRTVAGLVDGEKVVSGLKKMKAKNVGKANATTPEEQARVEAEALYEKKLAQGAYHESLDDISIVKYTKPQLAEPYKDSLPLDFSNGGLYSQPKLDGMRCLSSTEGLFTRKGKPWVSVPHIYVALEWMFRDHPHIKLDGELYNHDFHDDFDELSSMLRKTKNLGPEVLKKSAELAEYHVYDIVDPTMNFADRYQLLTELMHKYQPPMVKLVPTVACLSQEAVDTVYFDEYLPNRYEGQILRYNVPYKFDGRHKSLMVKRKEFFDEEFEIVSIGEGEGNWAGHAKFLEYKLKHTPDGMTEDGQGRRVYPRAGIKGSKAFAQKLLEEKDQYVAGHATIRFPNKTPSGIPRFPIATALFSGQREI